MNLNKMLAKVFGSSNEREVKRLRPIVEQVNVLEPEVKNLSDEELRRTTPEFREKLYQILGEDPAKMVREQAKKNGLLDEALNELMPEPVVEIPVSLGEKLGVKSGDWVKVSSARGEVTVKAMVTRRMAPLQVDGKEVTIVWMPYNWGFQGLSTGASVNHLTIDAVDPGAGTQETKACLVNVVKIEEQAAKTWFRGKPS